MLKSRLTFRNLCIVSFLLRAILLVYGEYQDAYFTVKYTDIDYVVFTDAARFITQGQSPYLRDTYRYTPLLAYLLTPNIYWFRSFGKCIFALADLVVGYLIHRILVLRGMPSRTALLYNMLWLLNPMVANISTRGNAESLLNVMVLGTLYLILTKKWFFAGSCLFGLAVHFKIYPVIYAVPLLMLLDKTYEIMPGANNAASSSATTTTTTTTRGAPKTIEAIEYNSSLPILIPLKLQHLHCNLKNTLKEKTRQNEKDRLCRFFLFLIEFITPLRIMFAFISASVFFLLTGWMYYKFGDEFLQHTYLYHVTREDHRHNFSVWFYQMYLSMMNKNAWMGLITFLPQFMLVITTGIVFGKDTFFACFIQTFVFVTFNKVVTSQYFMWYICFLPIVLPSTKMHFKWKGLALLIAWVAGQAFWLNYAYQLEFRGQNTFLQLWICGLFFFIVNAWIIVEFITSHRYEPVFGSTTGRIRWVLGNGDPGTRR